MSRLLEDILTENDVSAIEAVQASSICRFDELVKISNLDPMIDFQHSDLRCLDMRGADLRGFNFTGSDLRQCVLNKNTLIDDTTIFSEATLDWIESDALPVVQQMQKIEIASSSGVRQDLLKQLVAEHGRSDHVVTYLVRAANNAQELEKFLDFLTQLPAKLSADQLLTIRNQSQKLLSKKFRQAKSRTRRDKTTIFAVEPILARLKDSPGELGRRVFGHVAEVVNSKEQTKALLGMVTPDPVDLEKAFSLLGSR